MRRWGKNVAGRGGEQKKKGEATNAAGGVSGFGSWIGRVQRGERKTSLVPGRKSEERGGTTQHVPARASKIRKGRRVEAPGKGKKKKKKTARCK